MRRLLVSLATQRQRSCHERLMLTSQFDPAPANRYSRSDPLDLTGGGPVNEQFGAGSHGGHVEPFPYTHPTSPQASTAGEQFDPYQQAANRSSWLQQPMQMPDAHQYAAQGPGAAAGGPGGSGVGGGWYGNDGYAVAAGMAGAGLGAGAGAAAGAAAARGYDQSTDRDYRSETASQGGESSAYGGYGNQQQQQQRQSLPPLTPAALAKQREANGGRQPYQTHQSYGSRQSYGSSPGPSGGGGAGGYGPAPTSPGGLSSNMPHQSQSGASPSIAEEADRRRSSNFSEGRSVYQHADMPGQDEEPVEIPPK